jgi:hypothetical protein
MKANIWVNFFLRAIHLSSNPDDLKHEIDYLFALGQKNGYQETDLHNYFQKAKTKATNKISNSKVVGQLKSNPWIGLPVFYPVTGKLKRVFKEYNINTALIPPLTIHKNFTQFKSYYVSKDTGTGVYQANCQCGEFYIGLTKRCVNVRISEHIRDSKKEFPTSGLSQHLKNSKHDIIDVKLLKRTDSHKERLVYESYYIRKKKPKLNLDQGILNKKWYSILK